jgi:hypothetical protein
MCIQQRFVRGIAARVVVGQLLDGRLATAPFERRSNAP